MKTLLRGVAVAAVMSGLFTYGASAQLTSAGLSCSVNDAFLQGFGYADGCSGWWVGNNKNQDADVLAAISGWLTNPYEGPSLDTDGWGTGGTIDLGNTYSDFVLALKAGDQFSLYYFSGGGSMVDFDIDDLGNGLSHWTVYGGDGTSVPEPGTLLLFGTGLLGMAFIRRREDAA